MGDGAVLAGRVSVAEHVSLARGFFAAFTGLFFVLLIASLLAAGTLVAVLTLISFFAVTTGFLYVSRRVKHASSATEAELLIMELREFIAQSQEMNGQGDG
jgi:hypothetical protein